MEEMLKGTCEREEHRASRTPLGMSPSQHLDVFINPEASTISSLTPLPGGL